MLPKDSAGKPRQQTKTELLLCALTNFGCSLRSAGDSLLHAWLFAVEVPLPRDTEAEPDSIRKPPVAAGNQFVCQS